MFSSKSGGKLEGDETVNIDVLVMEASSRRYAHGEGITHLCYDAKRYASGRVHVSKL